MSSSFGLITERDFIGNDDPEQAHAPITRKLQESAQPGILTKEALTVEYTALNEAPEAYSWAPKMLIGQLRGLGCLALLMTGSLGTMHGMFAIDCREHHLSYQWFEWYAAILWAFAFLGNLITLICFHELFGLSCRNQGGPNTNPKANGLYVRIYLPAGLFHVVSVYERNQSGCLAQNWRWGFFGTICLVLGAPALLFPNHILMNKLLDETSIVTEKWANEVDNLMAQWDVESCFKIIKKYRKLRQEVIAVWGNGIPFLVFIAIGLGSIVLACLNFLTPDGNYAFDVVVFLCGLVFVFYPLWRIDESTAELRRAHKALQEMDIEAIKQLGSDAVFAYFTMLTVMQSEHCQVTLGSVFPVSKDMILREMYTLALKLPTLIALIKTSLKGHRGKF